MPTGHLFVAMSVAEIQNWSNYPQTLSLKANNTIQQESLCCYVILILTELRVPIYFSLALLQASDTFGPYGVI